MNGISLLPDFYCFILECRLTVLHLRSFVLRAYLICIHSDPRQFELLLSTVYRPFNVYCIHLGTKPPLHLHTSKKSENFRPHLPFSFLPYLCSFSLTSTPSLLPPPLLSYIYSISCTSPPSPFPSIPSSDLFSFSHTSAFSPLPMFLLHYACLFLYLFSF